MRHYNKVLDLSGMVSDVATVWVNLRLNRENNTKPISTPLLLSTDEDVTLLGKFVSADLESPNHLTHSILVEDPFGLPTLGELTQNDPYSGDFVYRPR